MMEQVILNLDGSKLGWLVYSSDGIRWIEKRISNAAAEAIFRAMRDLKDE